MPTLAGPDASPAPGRRGYHPIYTLPPAAIYYAFKRYMVAGLTAGAVQG